MIKPVRNTNAGSKSIRKSKDCLRGVYLHRAEKTIINNPAGRNTCRLGYLYADLKNFVMGSDPLPTAGSKIIRIVQL